MDDEHLEIAEKVGVAFSNKDVVALRKLYHDDAEIWHNYDGKSLPMTEALERAAVVFTSFDEVSLMNVRRHSIENGFVQQHDYVFANNGGEPLSIPVCQVVTVKAGKISRVEAYRDGAAVNSVPPSE
jgi:ketosteroid isomerase-like protein